VSQIALTKIKAETAEATIKRVIREHGIDAEQQKRLAADRIA